VNTVTDLCFHKSWNILTGYANVRFSNNSGNFLLTSSHIFILRHLGIRFRNLKVKIIFSLGYDVL